MIFKMFMKEDGDALRKLARADEERTSVSKRGGFAGIIFGDEARVEKSARPHSHVVMVEGKFHSGHGSKRSALATAQDCLDEGLRNVSVRASADDADEEYAMRKSPRAMNDEDDDMPDDERADRGLAPRRKRLGDGVFRSVIDPDVRSFDIADTSRGGRVDPADIGEDGLGRAYDDSAYNRLGGLNMDQPGTSPVPRSGSGETWEGDTRDVVYRPTAFSRGAEDGHIGGAEKPFRAVGPNIEPGQGAAYRLLSEGKEAGSAPVRLGESWIMNPEASGIADAAGFRAPEPATSIKKSRGGLFTDVVCAPIPGSNFFDR